jgi:hypothetical protein
MNGVDVADQLRTYYSTKLRSRKWWHTFFFWVLDTAICNAYICYCIWWKQEKIEGQPLSHADFRKALAYNLAKIKLNATPIKTSRECSAAASKFGPTGKAKSHFPRLIGKTQNGKRNLLQNCVWCRFQAHNKPRRQKTKVKDQVGFHPL